MAHSSSPWSVFLCQTQLLLSSALLQGIPAVLSCSPMPVSIPLPPTQHMDPPCHRQVCCCPRKPQSLQCSISGPRSQPPAPAEEATFGNGSRNVVSLEMLLFVWGLVTNGRVEGVTEQIPAFCCHKEKGFRVGEEISESLPFSTVIIHFCPLAAIGSLFQLQSYLPGYSRSIQ